MLEFFVSIKIRIMQMSQSSLIQLFPFLSTYTHIHTQPPTWSPNLPVTKAILTYQYPSLWPIPPLSFSNLVLFQGSLSIPLSHSDLKARKTQDSLVTPPSLSFSPIQPITKSWEFTFLSLKTIPLSSYPPTLTKLPSSLTWIAAEVSTHLPVPLCFHSVFYTAAKIIFETEIQFYHKPHFPCFNLLMFSYYLSLTWVSPSSPSSSLSKHSPTLYSELKSSTFSQS